MDKYDRVLRSLGLVMLLLTVQFALGMYLFYYSNPKPIVASFATYMSGNPVLAAHVVNAFLLVVATFMAFFMAIHARIGNSYIFASMISLIAVVLAGVSGMLFLMAGEHEIYSYEMFVFMLLAYAGAGIASSGARKAKS